MESDLSMSFMANQLTVTVLLYIEVQGPEFSAITINTTLKMVFNLQNGISTKRSFFTNNIGK